MSLFPQQAMKPDSAKKNALEWLHDIESQLKRIPQDIGIVKSLIKAVLQDGLVNDRELFLERLIQLCTSFPDNTEAQEEVTGKLLENLWDNLKHPPLSLMGDDWKYRKADGSNNNVMYPDLGKAGSNYARSVVPKHAPSQPLPDPGAVFDAVFAREGAAKPHPTKFSSTAIALATIIIHDIFRTDDADINKVASSSYLDLGPLYGHNETQQATVRTFQDGKLKPDTFAEARILGQPPGVAALLISFNRFHNYVVGQIAKINENGKFTLASEGDEKAAAKRDNDLFQTGRLITSGLYVNIILNDYVRVILNLNRTNSMWSLDPRVDSFSVFDSTGTPKGVGNQVSIEFNLIYRWHATVSDKNATWISSFFEEVFPGQDPATLSQADFLAGMSAWGHSIDADPAKWTFGGLERSESGGFQDKDLVRLLTEQTEDVAGAFGARNVPAIMRAIDVLGIEQGRAWGTASLNELREFFKLTPHQTFLDINPDPEIATALEALYGHPDNVELYTGISVEETKEPIVPGSGLCSGLTIAKAILSDAVALVRGDRFHSVDNSPANLTSFGYAEINSDKNVAAGTCIHKLLKRAYPGWYRADSVYALFPLTVPEENRKILKDLGKEAEYSYDPPSLLPDRAAVSTFKGVDGIMKDKENFSITGINRFAELTHQTKAPSKPASYQSQVKPYSTDDLTQIQKYYETATTNLIEQQKMKLRTSTQIDAANVCNLTTAGVLAETYHIKLKENGGDITTKQLYEALASIYAYAYVNWDESNALALENDAVSATSVVIKALTESSKEVNSFLSQILEKVSSSSVLHNRGTSLIQDQFAQGKSLDQVVASLVPSLVVSGPMQSLTFSNILEFYLKPNNAFYWSAIQKAAESSDMATLKKYVLEGLRLAPPSDGIFRTAIHDTTITDGDSTINVKAGDIVLLDCTASGLDPIQFRGSSAIDLDRPEDSYLDFSYGGSGNQLLVLGLAAQLKVFAGLKNLRSVDGAQGDVIKVLINKGVGMYMNDNASAWTPFLGSWKLYFDE